MGGIFRGLSHLHSQGIAHRDLKLENVIVTEKEDLSSVKITDIGFATKLCPQEASDRALHAARGTPLYIAPEEILSSEESQKASDCGTPVDMWACGIMLFTLLSGHSPFSADGDKSMMREVFADIKKGRFDFDEHIWKGLSESAKDLIMSLLDVNPERRISAKEALRHPWFRKCNESAEANSFVMAPAFVRSKQFATTTLKKKTTTSTPPVHNGCQTLTLYKKALLNQAASASAR